MLANDFRFMIKQFGVEVYLNEETVTRRVLLSSRGLSKTEVNFDDKVAHTDFPIKRGDIFTYNDVLYLVYSDVQNKRGHEYQSLIRPMTNVFNFTYMTEGYFEERDRLGNIIWIIEPEEVTEPLPCIAQQEGSPTIEGSQIRQPETRIQVIMPDNYASQQIEMDTEHTVLNHNYNIVDVNLFQAGIRIFTMEWATQSS